MLIEVNVLFVKGVKKAKLSRNAIPTLEYKSDLYVLSAQRDPLEY